MKLLFEYKNKEILRLQQIGLIEKTTKQSV